MSATSACKDVQLWHFRQIRSPSLVTVLSLALLTCLSLHPCAGFKKKGIFGVYNASSKVTQAAEFSPQTKEELKLNIDACLELSPEGHSCRGSPGPMGQWDVSRVTDMSRLFAYARKFNADISKWDVSRVATMNSLFLAAASFEGDLSKWDVSSVTDMNSIFRWVTTFQGDISKWDVSNVENMGNMFGSTMFNSDISKWNVSRVTNMDSMFSGAEGFDGDISKWDVSKAQKMSHMFAYSVFNRDISKWDVSSVTNIKGMFSGNPNFNGDISKWDVSRVVDMSRMFMYAKSFNVDLSKWDVSRVKDMEFMFARASAFSHQLSGDAWEQSKATQTDMFLGSSGSLAKAPGQAPVTDQNERWAVGSKEELLRALEICFTQSETGECEGGMHGAIKDWDVSKVNDMRALFQAQYNFQGDISKWNVANVTDMSGMFLSAVFFNRDISNWNVSKVTDMSTMFYNAAYFACDISKWDVSRVDNMNRMFTGAQSFTHELVGDAWVNSRATKVFMFAGSPGQLGPRPKMVTSRFTPHTSAELKRVVDACLERSPKGFCPRKLHGAIGKWDVLMVTDMSGMFKDATSFSADILKWDVSRVKNMYEMFFRTRKFNGDLSKWDVRKVTGMDRMFMSADAYSRDLSAWDVSGVASMSQMFADKSTGTITSFNKKWDVSGVTSMYNMFWKANWFNSDLSKWDVTNVNTMCGMFFLAERFSRDLSKWGVHRVTDMSSMFWGATSFQCDLSNWNVARVGTMNGMFFGAKKFNADISKWDVSRVTNMVSMFMGAESFNIDISRWDVSKVTTMIAMFSGATSFKHKLCGPAWVYLKISKEKRIEMFDGSHGSIATRVCEQRELLVHTTNHNHHHNQVVCAKCGAFKKFGRRSCCAPGGSWYQKCGEEGDPNVDHKWRAGAEACNLAIMTLKAIVCPTCGVIQKSGKLSCCARGGSWYGNCAATLSAQREHTWYEGLYACKEQQAQDGMVQQQKAVHHAHENVSHDVKAPVSALMPANAPMLNGTQITVPSSTSQNAMAIQSARHSEERIATDANSELTPIVVHTTDTTSPRLMTIASIAITHPSVHMSTPTHDTPTTSPLLSTATINSVKSPPSTPNHGIDCWPTREFCADVASVQSSADGSIVVTKNGDSYFKRFCCTIGLIFLVTC